MNYSVFDLLYNAWTTMHCLNYRELFELQCCWTTLCLNYIMYELHCAWTTLCLNYIVFELHCDWTTLFLNYIVLELHLKIRSNNKHGWHRQFLLLIGWKLCFLLKLFCLIDCWLLNVQWQIFHEYSGREQTEQYINIMYNVYPDIVWTLCIIN